MKLIKKNVEQLRKESGNKLFKNVCSYVIDEWSDYTDKKNIFLDVLKHGCQSGIVTHLIYYSDTTRFYKKYQKEINELLYDTLRETGFLNPHQMFGDKWDEEDPLALNVYNQNLLAWFSFEETLREVAMNFEELERYV